MPADTAAEASSPTTTYIRLHISPFDAALTPVVLHNTIRPRARNISYHTLDTFPDKPYGFVELPKEDADKLKKKLNGAVLKGSKVRIEVARPDPQADRVNSKKKNKEKKSSKCQVDPDAPPKDRLRKRKREQGVIQGSEIEGPRKIKRGWTTSEAEMIQKKRDRAAREREERKKDKDSNSGNSSKKDFSSSKEDKKSKKKDLVKKSKYTDEPECLFKTKLPSKSKKEDASPAIDVDKEGDGVDGEKRKKKKRRTETTTAVIHEFEKTQKFPSFLKVSSDKTRAETTTFEDGKGWVDKDGNVVESSKSKRPADAGIVPAQKKDRKKKKMKEPMPEPESDSSSNESSSDDEEQRTEEVAADTTSEEEDSSDSDSDSSSEDEAEEEVFKTPAKLTTTKLEQITQQAATTPTSATRPKSAGSVTSLTIKIPPATPGPAAKVEVHPLEALYKRPIGETATPAAQGFSFFGGADNDDIEDEDTAMTAEPTTQTLQVPMTPFTEQDFEFRAMRSAAPTPDTAHPNRSFAPWSTQDTVDEEDEEEEEDGPESPTKHYATGDSTMLDADDDAGDIHPSRRAMNGAESAKDAAKKAGPITDFQKHFWENRGDLNRKWRKRRKTAAKEKRYRDNRARADRAI